MVCADEPAVTDEVVQVTCPFEGLIGIVQLAIAEPLSVKVTDPESLTESVNGMTVAV